MKLKTKLSLSISLLVLFMVLVVSFIYLAGVVREQMQDVYAHADFLSREVFNEVRQEMQTAADNGKISLDQPTTIRDFFAGLSQSSALNTLFSSAIGYPDSSVVRDVALIGPDDVVDADSNPLLVGTRQAPRPRLDAIVAGSTWQRMRAIFGSERIYEVHLPLQLGSEPLGSIRIGVDTVLLRSALAGRIRSLALSGLIIVLCSALLAIGVADFILAPLTAISEQLDRLVRGQTTEASPLQRSDEYGQVSSKIQQLGRQMQDVRQIYSSLQENVTHVLESLEEGLFLFNAGGNVLLASAAAQRLLGLEGKALIGRPVEDLFAGDSSLDRAVRLAVRQHVAIPDREVERQIGGRQLLIRIDLVQVQGGQTGALLTVRDAERMHRLEDELEVARRLSAIGRLTRGVAHEVKNPLNAMAIHLDLLKEKARSGNGNVDLHVDVIRHEIDRLDRVVKTFLDFSRPVEMHLSEVDLIEMARRIADLSSARAAGNGITLEIQTDDPPPRAWIDRDLVEQALLNLVNNAIDAMPPPEEMPAGVPRKVLIEVRRKQEQAMLRVRDFGPGIPKENREKIFDLYFTTRPEGSGIGLALTARVMQVHNGSIELESIEGPGASFLLRFPAQLRNRVEVSV